MPRAARRQPIVLSSDDEADLTSSPQRSSNHTQRLVTGIRAPKSATRSSQSSRTRSAHVSPSLLSTPASTQETASAKPLQPSQPNKSPTKSPAKAQAIYKPISSFFNVIPQRQQSIPLPDQEQTTRLPADEDEDYIQDSSMDESPNKAPNTRSEAVTALALRKRARNTLGDGLSVEGDGLPGGSQKFLKTQTGARGVAPLSQPPSFEIVDQRPWTERYGPVSLDELAVHKRKVSDVRKWLHDVFEGRERKRLLLLKGPAGSGKTTTMKLLADDLAFEVHEWKNPTNAVFADGAMSMTAQFEDFIGRTGKFGSLDFQGAEQPQKVPGLVPKSGGENEVIMVEEFPNTFTPSSTSVQAFRSSIQQFLAMSTPSMGAFLTRQKDAHRSATPMILIISETLLSTNTAAADSFTAHRLLGPEILNHPAVTTMEFNPIAPTLMAKALELIVKKEARKTGRRKTAGPQVIQRLSEVGDIRSAVSSLEFLCVRGDDHGWGAKVAFTKPKKGTQAATLTKMEQESLEIITQRESTLGIFHAVGKVVHNKREVPSVTCEPIPQPPHYFPEHRRSKPPQVNVDGLIDDLGTDIQTFIAALHENYLLSCDGGSAEDTMDSINGCIEALSDADLLSSDRFGSGAAARLTFQGTSADNLRQDELSFQVSVRGILFNLPSPVKRLAPPPGATSNKGKAGSRSSAYSMFYPTSLRIWRQREEMEGMLDMWIGRARSGSLFAPLVETTRKTNAKASGVESWRRDGSSSQPTESRSDPPLTSRTKAEEETGSILLGSGNSAKHEMLLERLPFVAIIMRNRTSITKTGSLRDIEKVTAFSGIGGSSEDVPDDDDGYTGIEQWNVQLPSAEGRKVRGADKRNRAGRLSPMPTTTVESDVSKLVLSDDDIEDD